MLDVSLHPSTPENSSSDYVLFQAGSTVRDAVVREWEVLSGGERVGLRGYLLHYITSRPESVHMYISARLYVHNFCLKMSVPLQNVWARFVPGTYKKE